jgi:hypothetical protein
MLNTNVTLSDNEQDQIDYIMFSGYFPWYRAPYQTIIDIDPKISSRVDNPSFFKHVLMERSPDPEIPGQVSSDAYGLFYKIFRRWCYENQLKINIIYRANLNLITYNNKEFTVPHHDHEWQHQIWIMYLNTVNDAPTVLFDNNLTIERTVPAIKNTALLFKDQLHAHGFPRNINEHRFVAVFTFS